MATTIPANEIVTIKPAEIQRIPIRIIGDTPLIVHNWDEKSKRQMLDKERKATKTKAQPPKHPFKDFVNSMYWLTERPTAANDAALEKAFADALNAGARFGFPVTAVKQAANSAAYRNGWVSNQMGLRGAYFLETDDVDYFEIKGSIPKMREDMVRVKGSADLRYRAEFSGWYADFTLVYNGNGNITLEQIINCIQAGGFSCGIGEWRPERDGTFGRFHVAAGDELN